MVPRKNPLRRDKPKIDFREIGPRTTAVHTGHPEPGPVRKTPARGLDLVIGDTCTTNPRDWDVFEVRGTSWEGRTGRSSKITFK